MAEERRRFSRVPFKVNAEVTINDVIYRVDEIVNLSVGGCLLPIKADLASGTPCEIKIFLSGTESEMSLRMDGAINRRDANSVAVRFVRINPESRIHLQNIVRYNSPDADVIESEIIKNPGIF